MDSTPSTVISAIKSAGSAWNTVYAKAPVDATYNGKRYRRDKAKTPEAQAFFLAAAAVSKPETFLAMRTAKGFEGAHFLDADPSALRDAEKALRDATKKRDTLKQTVSKGEAAVQRATEAVNRAKANLKSGSKVRASDVLTLGIGHSVRQGELEAAVNKAAASLDDARSQLEDVKVELADAESAVRNAQQDLRTAQQDYNAENQRLRQQEEQERQEKLRQQQQEAAARQAELAAQRREQAAQYAASNGYGYQDPYSAGQGYGYPGAYYEQADVYGDADYALQMLDDLGEKPPLEDHVETARSPWSFDTYYADACKCGGKCEDCKTYGLDAMTIISGILSAILTLAPILLSIFLPQAPPAEPEGSTSTPTTPTSEDSAPSGLLPLVVIAAIIAAG